MTAAVLCETAADVESSRQVPGGTLVALTPAAWMEADRIRIPCRILEEFYGEFDLAELRYPVLGEQLAWMDRLDAALTAAAPDIGRHALRMSRLWFYFLKRLCDPFTVMGFAAAAMLDRLRAETLWLPAAKPLAAPDWPSYFRVGPHGRVVLPEFSLADVAADAATARGIRVQRLAGPTEIGDTAAAPGARTSLRHGLRVHASPWMLDGWALVRKFGWRGLRHLGPAARGGNRLLVLRGGYDLDLLVDAAAPAYAVDYWSRLEKRARLSSSEQDQAADVRAACAAAWPGIKSQSWLYIPVDRGGDHARRFARDALSHFVTRTVPDSFEAYLRGRALLRNQGYLALLAPGGMRATSLLAAARAEDIPVVLYQHGGFVGTCEHLMWDYCDFTHADTLIVYGEGERRYFERRRALYADRRAEVRTAGSARLEQQLARTSAADIAAARAAIGLSAGSRVVLYAATMTSGYARMVAAESYPETRCFLNQVRALEVMREFPGVTFVFKPYSDRDDRAIREMATRRGVSNCRVIANVPLMLLMQAADAIAVEFPSTALLEAVMTDKPIAAYVDRESLRLEADAAVRLRERATVAESFDDFLAAIRDLAEGRGVAGGGPSSRFAREYALDPAQPAAAAALGVLRETIGARAG